jgi:putative Mg2+ transporter-C (MgtC) family protein
MKELLDIVDPRLHPSMAVFVSQVLIRLLLAATLGGAIGLEREMKRKPAGLRTNMFICFGSAMFTILSDRLAGEFSGDHTRIAAQIIPGIGFIGAGSILHSRGSVQGLTSAATMFVVASIGMACGGGLYLVAAFATMLLVIALNALGMIETRLGFKPVVMTYEAQGDTSDIVLENINYVLERENLQMQWVQSGKLNGMSRLVFAVEAFRSQHKLLMDALRAQTGIKHFTCISTKEQE